MYTLALVLAHTKRVHSSMPTTDLTIDIHTAVGGLNRHSPRLFLTPHFASSFRNVVECQKLFFLRSLTTRSLFLKIILLLNCVFILLTTLCRFSLLQIGHNDTLIAIVSMRISLLREPI